MNYKTRMQIEESYRHFKPYLSEKCGSGKELREMCKHCEKYCGKEHDWEDCLDTPCFRFYLAYEYLEWLNSSDGY